MKSDSQVPIDETTIKQLQGKRYVLKDMTVTSYAIRIIQLITFITSLVLDTLMIVSFGDNQYTVTAVFFISFQTLLCLLSTLGHCIDINNISALQEIHSTCLQSIFEISQFIGMEPIFVLLFQIFTGKYGILMDDCLTQSQGGFRQHLIFHNFPMILIYCHIIYFTKSNSHQESFKQMANMDLIETALGFSVANVVFGFLFFSKSKQVLLTFRLLIQKFILTSQIYLIVGEIIARPMLFGLTAMISRENWRNLDDALPEQTSFTEFWIYFEIGSLGLVFLSYAIYLIIQLENYEEAFSASFKITVGCALIHPWVDSQTYQSYQHTEFYQKSPNEILQRNFNYFQDFGRIPSYYRIVELICISSVLIFGYQLDTLFNQNPDSSTLIQITLALDICYLLLNIVQMICISLGIETHRNSKRRRVHDLKTLESKQTEKQILQSTPESPKGNIIITENTQLSQPNQLAQNTQIEIQTQRDQ